MSTISLIVAMGTNRVIGRDNQLPWRLPADLKRFRKVTMGKAMIMGRAMYEMIGRPLDGRRSIVLTRDRYFEAEGCAIAHSIPEALQAAGEGEIMILGGGQVYAEMLAMADRIYLTLIDEQFEGDTIFPEFDETAWREVSRENFAADASNPYNYSFIVLDRRPAAEGV